MAHISSQKHLFHNVLIQNGSIWITVMATTGNPSNKVKNNHSTISLKTVIKYSIKDTP